MAELLGISTTAANSILQRARGERLEQAAPAEEDSPAAAASRADDGSFQAHAIQVLTVTGGQVARIASFNDGRLLHAFGLPDQLSPSVVET